MSASLAQLLVVGLIGLNAFVLSFDDEFEGSRTLSLEHSFDQGSDPVFTKRGSIIIRSVKSNKAVFSPVGSLSHEERKLLRDLAVTDGIYRIRVATKSNGEDGEYVSSFTKACSIYESSLSDYLIVSADQSGEVLGISMTTQTSCHGIDVPSSNLTDWKTVVDISVTVQGPTPDTQSYIDKMKREEAEKAKGQQGDNRSFIAKYWMYIVPFIVIMMLMQSMDPNQGGGGGGGGGR